ncbi:MAG: response regulator [Cyanobacteria bacterium J06626_18]
MNLKPIQPVQKPLPLSIDVASGQFLLSSEPARILIVEDSPRIAALMVKGLQRYGFVCEVVTDGGTALDKVLVDSFDLMLLDLGLPVKDGRSVLYEVRLRGLQLPIIVVTAHSLDPREDEIVYTYANEVVNKPFTMNNLIQKVRSLL